MVVDAVALPTKANSAIIPRRKSGDTSVDSLVADNKRRLIMILAIEYEL